MFYGNFLLLRSYVTCHKYRTKIVHYAIYATLSAKNTRDITFTTIFILHLQNCLSFPIQQTEHIKQETITYICWDVNMV